MVSHRDGRWRDFDFGTANFKQDLEAPLCWMTLRRPTATSSAMQLAINGRWRKMRQTSCRAYFHSTEDPRAVFGGRFMSAS